MGDTVEPTLAQLMAAIQGLTNRMTQLENQQNQETENTTESSTDPARANLNQNNRNGNGQARDQNEPCQNCDGLHNGTNEARTEKKTSHGMVGRV
ncbi:unnamed protein product [Arabis nemorensis]|uniref:Uncharacterized protein n=1 Tax=Arabis nemorensis TaxID=586526 RepID=A0A565BLE7_9BRAS|nr:unnamed protein product [Arabis nemorensis]